MRISWSTNLLMLLSLETLTSIIRTSLSILVELIDLVNSVIIFLSQATLFRWLAVLLRSLTVTVTVLLFLSYFFLLTLSFWSYCCSSFHWLTNKLKMRYPVSSQSLQLFLCWLGWFFWSFERCSTGEWVQIGIDVYIPHRKY